MTKTIYYNKKTLAILSHEEFFKELNKNNKDVTSETECLECGNIIEAYETCSCGVDDEDEAYYQEYREYSAYNGYEYTDYEGDY